MATVVDVTVPASRFALAETFTVVTGVTVETVRVAAHSPGSVMPFVRVSSEEATSLDVAIRDDSTTNQVTSLSGDETDRLYRIRWDRSVRQSIETFVDPDGSLLGAYGEANRWELRLLFPDEASVSKAYSNWRDNHIDPSIQRVKDAAGLVDHRSIELSSCQQETLLRAFETDYYDVPRGITLNGLSDELDVSHQALSERLRRGHRNLIATTLRDSPDTARRDSS